MSAVRRDLANGQPLAVFASGHYRADADVSEHIRYIVQTAARGNPRRAEFAERYGCKNDPGKIRLVEE